MGDEAQGRKLAQKAVDPEGTTLETLAGLPETDEERVTSGWPCAQAWGGKDAPDHEATGYRVVRDAGQFGPDGQIAVAAAGLAFT